MKGYDTAIIIGGGAFGTSMACVLAPQFKTLVMTVRTSEVYQNIRNGENTHYLPGWALPSEVVAALTWQEVITITKKKRVDLIVFALPSSAIKSYCEENFQFIIKYLQQGIPFVSLSKGIDEETLELPDDLFMHKFLDFRDQFCFLSGPSFAKEIVEKQITLVNIAGRSKEILHKTSNMFQSDYFCTIPSYDIKGLLLGGALKNILAIAVGIIEGLGYNHNTRAALMTMGIVDMLHLGAVFNARPETFYGLCGMGDLILSSTGDLSRNKIFGREIAKGRKASEIIASSHSVVEGYKTTKAAEKLAEKYDIKCRIFHGVYQVLYEDVRPEEVITQLMRFTMRAGMLR